MGNHYFTAQEQAELQSNPYVKKASQKAITYTEAFKSHFHAERLSGKLPRQIFKEAGFNLEALGDSRIDSFTKRMKKQASRPEGFVDQRRFTSGRPSTKDRSPQEEIEYLKHQLALKDQQIDFLKKMKGLETKSRATRRNGSP